MEKSNITSLLKRISLGEASSEDRRILDSLSSEEFYLGLKTSGLVESQSMSNLPEEVTLLDLLDHEEEDTYAESKSTYQVDTPINVMYAEVIPEAENISECRLLALSKGKLRRFVSKQRVSVYDLSNKRV